MNKIRVIDLLNKIANDEEVPKKVKFAGIIFEYDEDDQMYNNYEYKNICDYAFLNDEVEIIEEEIIEEEKKIPEKFKINYEIDDDNTINLTPATNLECDLAFKINEIIDYLDYLKSKGE